jgi:glucose-1-phosphate adenylyltransferase
VVERCVLSPGVYVGPEAVVRESIILTDASIEGGARVERAIIDKAATIGHNARVGRIDAGAADLGITTIGKGVQIPAGMSIGRGAIVGPDVTADYLPPTGVEDGGRSERLPFGKKTQPL